MKQKPEPKTVGPLKDEDFIPWNGITLNRCLAIAAIAALLSVGFQILQESVDSDDLAEPENDIWTSPESNEQQSSEPWFFENWFGSSTPNLPIIEEPEIPETAEPDISEVEELEQPIDEESELTDEEIETETEAEAELELEEPIETEKQEEKKEKKKPSEQWGLKSKGRYMEAKAIKIRRAENGSQKKEVFPFNLAKKPKDSAKPSPEGREKPYKDTKYQKKYNEKKYDSPKKQEYEKSFKKEREEHNKYFKQDKGKKEDKEYKAYKQYHYEKDYKKKYDPRHHG